MMASLDHAMWFHRPFRADEWLLYDQDTPSASGGRGLARGSSSPQDGRPRRCPSCRRASSGMTDVTRSRRRAVLAAAVAVAVLGVGCSSDSSSSSSVGEQRRRGHDRGRGVQPPRRHRAPRPRHRRSASSSPGRVDVVASDARLPQLALTDIAKLDGAPTSVATRCQEHALYVTQQAGAVVRIDLDASADTPADDACSTSATVVTAGGEQGLLGLAFSPDGRPALRRLHEHGAEPGARPLHRVGRRGRRGRAARASSTSPDFRRTTTAASCVFGPDGYLYIGLGDGGGAGDPKHTGQDPSRPARQDPAHRPDAPRGRQAVRDPARQPVRHRRRRAGDLALRPAQPVAVLVRPANGDLWIGDVGQDKIEEIDHLGRHGDAGPAPTSAGARWRAPSRTTAARRRSASSRCSSTATTAAAAR